MKVKLLVNSEYKETEIHICNDRDDVHARKVYETIKGMFDLGILAYDNEDTVMVNSSDIIRVYAANKQVFITTAKGDYRIKERLYEFEEKMSSAHFVRISNSEIVNINKLQKMNTGVTGTIIMTLSDGVETYVSRRYVPKIKAALGL